jgi:hypothetical protein
MATPFAPFANARILWQAPGARSSGRDGYALQPGQSYLLVAFLKRAEQPQVLDLPALAGASIALTGYLVGAAPLEPEQVADWRTIALAGLTVDDSGLRPEGLERNCKGQAEVVGFGEIAVRFASIGTAYGDDGIGALMRLRTGDPLILAGGQVG